MRCFFVSGRCWFLRASHWFASRAKPDRVRYLFCQIFCQVDALRVESVVRGYAANAAEILPLQRPARTLLPPLLFCMACEVLHVRLLAPEVWYDAPRNRMGWDGMGWGGVGWDGKRSSRTRVPMRSFPICPSVSTSSVSLLVFLSSSCRSAFCLVRISLKLTTCF